MIPKTNQIARQLTSVPQTHRTSTLSAISKKTHAVTARIEFIKSEGKKMDQMLRNLPDDVDSRLTWLSGQINQP